MRIYDCLYFITSYKTMPVATDTFRESNSPVMVKWRNYPESCIFGGFTFFIYFTTTAG